MVLRFSIWDDTNVNDIALAARLNLPIYTAVEQFNDELMEEKRCDCADCANCGKCYSNRYNWIACEIH